MKIIKTGCIKLSAHSHLLTPLNLLAMKTGHLSLLKLFAKYNCQDFGFFTWLSDPRKWLAFKMQYADLLPC